MNVFLKLTQAKAPHAPVWVNPTHISEMRVSESDQFTLLVKTSEEDNPVNVQETPEEVNTLIGALLTR